MSFSASGGVEGLEYFIKAYDMATPIFRAFGHEVEAVTRKVQASLESMNRAMVAQGRAGTEAMAKEGESFKVIQKGYTETAAKAQAAADAQIRASRKQIAASEEAAAATRKTAKVQTEAAATSEAAFGRSGSAISKTGRNIMIATAGAAAASLDMATKFQANTLRMETQAGVTAKQLDQIRQGLLKMAGDVGSTPNQLASGMYHVVSSMNAVIKPSQRVSVELDIMRAAAKGAQIGHSSLEDTTYALASAMNALHDSSHDANKVMGNLNATVGSGDMTMQDLIDSYKSGLIPTARSFHVTLTSVNAALAVMGDMGMRGALAGTRLRMALSLMGAPTKQAAGILESLGLTSTEAISRIHKFNQTLSDSGVHLTRLTQDLRKPDGVKAAMVDLNHQLRASGTTADGAAAIISRAFGGGRMGAAIALLSENTGRLGLKFDYIGDKANKFNKDWALTQASFRVQMDKALASLEAFGITIGNQLIPYATKGIHALEDTANWFLKNKTALDILGGAVITFSSVAIGSYLIGKLRNALDLMKSVGAGMGRMGSWMVGMNTAGADIGAKKMSQATLGEMAQVMGATSARAVTDAAAAAPATLGIHKVAGTSIHSGGGGLGSVMGGGVGMIFGYMGSMVRVGTMMNPIAVIMSAGAKGLGGAASLEQTAPVVGAGADPSAKKAMQDSSSAMTKAADKIAVGGVPIVDPKVKKILAEADAVIAKTGGAGDIAAVSGMAGRARWPAGDPLGRGGQVMSAVDAAKLGTGTAEAAKNTAAMSEILVAGQASVRELNAAEQDMADKLATGQLSIDELDGVEKKLTGQIIMSSDSVFALQTSADALASTMDKAAVKQAENLFTSAPIPAEHGAARLGEQLALGSTPAPVVNRAGDVVGVRKPVDITKNLGGIPTGAPPGARNLGALTAAEQTAAREAAVAAEEARLSSGINLSAARERAMSGIAGVRGFMGEAGGALMRGGTMAGMGVLASQMVGQMVPGKAGKDISAIGTSASIGAGVGTLATLIPGVGPIAGPLIGAIGGGLITGLQKLFASPSYGHQIADTLSKGFGGQNADTVKKTTADALDRAKAINDTLKPTSGVTIGDAQKQAQHDVSLGGAPTVTTIANPGAKGVGVSTVTEKQLSPEQIQKRAGDFQTAGTTIAKALEKGWGQYKFQSEPIMFQQLRTEIRSLPPQAQAVAIESAVKFSMGLEKQGRLASGSTQIFLDQAKAVLPHFEQFLGLSAQASVQTFIKNFDFHNAEANLKQTLDQMRGDFPEVVQAMDDTTGSIQDKSAAAIKALKDIEQVGTKPMKDQAKKDLADLVQSAGKSFGQLTDEAQTNSAKIKDAVSTNTTQAFQIGSSNFAALAKNIAGAIGAGAEATAKGLKNITDQVNAQLKGFGESGLSTTTIKSLSPAQLASVLTGQVSSGAVSDTGGGNPGHAIGGLVKTPSYMVGEEAPHHPEYILATNPAYRKRNLGLWAEAGKHLGIPGFRVGGSTGAGSGAYTFPFSKGEPFSWERIDQGQDLQTVPGGKVVAIGPGNVTIGHDAFSGFGPFYPVEQMSGGPFAGRGVYYGHTKTTRTGNVSTGDVIAVTQSHADEWTAAPAGWLEIGFTSALGAGIHGQGAAIAPELHALAAGHQFSAGIGGGGIGATAATWNNIKAPKVSGTGTIPDMVRGAFSTAIKAANKFGQKAAAKAFARSGGGASLISGLNGGVEHQIFQALSKYGWNKIAIAGAIGNAVQESDLQPGISGGGAAGLWQWTPPTSLFSLAAREHVPWQGVGIQAQLLNQQIGRGGVSAMNRQKTPGSAAAWMMTNFERPAVATENLARRVAGANSAFKAGFAEGGVLPFAGAFGDGGGFTATKPTLAMFGDKGPESVLAIPHYAIGGTHTSTTTRDTPKGQYVYVTVTNTTQEGGQKVTTTHRTETTPSGEHITTTTVGTASIPAPKAAKRSTHFNPITDKIESHTPQEWAAIHAIHAKERHDAALAKKKFDKYMAEQVQISLSAGGIDVGSFDETRRTELKNFGNIIGKGGKVDIFGPVDKLSANAFKKLVSEFNAGEKSLTVGQAMTIAATGAASLGKGPDKALVHHQDVLQNKLDELNKRMDKLRSDAETHHKSAHSDRVKIADLLKQAHHTSKNLEKTQTKIADSRPAQIENAAITNALTGIKSLFTNQQDQFTRTQNVAQILQSLPTGTTAKGLGLTDLQLKASKLTPTEVSHMSGGADPLGFLDQINQLTKVAIPQYQSDAKRLETLYKAALKTHNKKLQESILTELDTVTQAQLQANADLQAAQISEIDSIAKNVGDKTSTATATSTMVQRFQGYAAGTGSLGMSDAAMATLGISPLMQGGSNPVINAMQADQPLTTARTADVSALNQIQTLVSSGQLSADAQKEAVSQMQTLGSSIMDLTDTINKNLTAAIDANTAALSSTTADQSTAASILNTIENAPPGTSLTALGIDPATAAALGLPQDLSSLEGTGLTYLGNLSSSSGLVGPNGQAAYSPQMIAAAKQGISASNAAIQNEINTIMNGTAANSITGAPAIPGLSADEALLPSLTGSAAADMRTTILGLINTITGLNDTMNQNNQALQNLTKATNANTSATGQMTGSVGYSYQGQDYIAGEASMSSDSSINVGLGL